jgi:hypothetical protein
MIFSDQNLEKKDIKSLRLTSKELCPAGTREFAKRYLTDPCVTLTRYSLQSLVDMCKHPIFSAHIQSIGFLASVLSIQGLEDRVSQAKHEAQWQRNGVETLIDDLAEISNYSVLYKEQLRLKASEETKTLLAHAFGALNHTISSTITNDLESIGPNGVIGLPPTIYRYDGISRRRTAKPSDSDSKMGKVISQIGESIARLSPSNRISIAGLEITIKRRAQVATSNSKLDDHISIRGCEDMYSNLTTLHLELNLEALRGSMSLETWRDLFKAASKLENLSFSSGCAGNRAIGTGTLERVAKIFNIETTFQLKVLGLKSVPCTPETLLQLLQRHKKTLVGIKLCKVTLLGCWKPCLSWMRKELELEKLHISHPHIISRNNTTG